MSSDAGRFGLVPRLLRETGIDMRVRMPYTGVMNVYLNPYGCTWCGAGKHEHAILWHRAVGFHGWTAPTDAQVKQRMLANREAMR